MADAAVDRVAPHLGDRLLVVMCVSVALLLADAFGVLPFAVLLACPLIHLLHRPNPSPGRRRRRSRHVAAPG